MRHATSRERNDTMQDETPKTTTTNPALGRSTVARLPAEVREAVDRAIADGATIDEITARIRAAGERCWRSAVGRNTEDMRGLIRKQQEAERFVKAWMQEFGDRPEGSAGPFLIASLRAMTLAAIEHRGEGKEPVSPEELALLSLVLERIEATDKLRIQREQAEAKAAEAARPKPRKGPVTPAPADPWNPAESHLIPLNPGESQPENGSRASHAEPAPCGPLRPPPGRLH